MTKRRWKDKSYHDGYEPMKRLNALQTVDAYLKIKTATRRMIEADTGLHYGTVCGRVSDLKRMGRIEVLKIAIDPISGVLSQFMTTDPDLFPINQQLEIIWEDS